MIQIPAAKKGKVKKHGRNADRKPCCKRYRLEERWIANKKRREWQIASELPKYKGVTKSEYFNMPLN